MKAQIKQKYMHMKMLEQQIEKMQEQLQTFDNQLQEISSMKSAVEEIKTEKYQCKQRSKNYSEQMTQKGSAIEHEMRGLLEKHIAQGGTLDFDEDNEGASQKEHEEA